MEAEPVKHFMYLCLDKLIWSGFGSRPSIGGGWRRALLRWPAIFWAVIFRWCAMRAFVALLFLTTASHFSGLVRRSQFSTQ